jgi:hypothetical protein
MSECILTPEQFAYMQQHHEEIEWGRFAEATGTGTFVDDFISQPEYIRLFGNMGWDDVLDSYEDTPGYDESLRIEVVRSIKAAYGVEETDIPLQQSSCLNEDDDTLTLEKLIQLRDEQRKKSRQQKSEK